jgi:hypothetical protein
MATRLRFHRISDVQKQNIKTLNTDFQNSVEGTPSEAAVTQFQTTVKTAWSDRVITTDEFKGITDDVINVAESAGITSPELRTLFYDLQDIAETSRLPRTNDDLTGTTQNDILWGGLGSDRLNAAGADDAGKGEIDQLCGGGGKDTFILGDATQAFYDDANASTIGLSDYAVILDFNTKKDTIQLHGSASDYAIGALPQELGLKGTGIYSTTGNTRELVGVTVGTTLTDLNTGFSFV